MTESVGTGEKKPTTMTGGPYSTEPPSAGSSKGANDSVSSSHHGHAAELPSVRRVFTSESGESSKDASGKQFKRRRTELHRMGESHGPFLMETIEQCSNERDATATGTRESAGTGAEPEPIDDATIRLILQLQMEGVRELEQRSRGKEPEGEISDADLARMIYEEEIAAMGQIIEDRKMARSIGVAVQSDGQLVASHRAEEASATNDRRVACSLGGQDVPPNTEPHLDEFDDAFISGLAASYVGPAEKLRDEIDRFGDAGVECEICTDSVPQDTVASLPCGHPYCTNCLRQLFRASFMDEALFPPQCCRQQIPIDIAEAFLTPEALRVFRQKEIEFGTSDKTYCSVATCSVFIPPSNIVNEKALCDVCGTVTCSICKSKAHSGDCPQDTGTQQILQMAVEQGWQRCFNCKRVVELSFGCFHITCPCGCQFCYLCGESWKTCSCPLWDQDRLYFRANQIADRQADEQQPRELGLERALAIAQWNCGHENGWRRVRGRHLCEMCFNTLPNFVLRCQDCQLHACVRCLRNRL